MKKGILLPDNTVKVLPELEFGSPEWAEQMRVWAEAFGDRTRIIGRSEVGRAQISTVFLGMDHGYNGKHQWFETMMFKEGRNYEGHWENPCLRCETYQEALDQHKLMVEMETAFQKTIVGCCVEVNFYFWQMFQNFCSAFSFWRKKK